MPLESFLRKVARDKRREEDEIEKLKKKLEALRALIKKY